MANMTFINHGYVNAHNTEIDVAFTNTGTNDGIMSASGTGVLKVTFGQSISPPAATFTNNGLIEVEKSAIATISSQAPSSLNYQGTMTNNAVIDVNGGHLTLNTPWTQATDAVTVVRHHGTLTLDSSSDGGTIIIQSGMLDFDGANGITLAPPGIEEFKSTVDFVGRTASLHVPDLGLAISFKDATQELIIDGLSTRTPGAAVEIGDIHLTGGPYSLSNFSVDQATQTILFHH